MDDAVRALTLPCAHMCMCPDCAVRVRRRKMRCPICRARIKSVHTAIVVAYDDDSTSFERATVQGAKYI